MQWLIDSVIKQQAFILRWKNNSNWQVYRQYYYQVGIKLDFQIASNNYTETASNWMKQFELERLKYNFYILKESLFYLYNIFSQCTLYDDFSFENTFLYT